METSDVEAVLASSEFQERARKICRAVLGPNKISQRQASLLHGVSQTYVSATIKRFKAVQGRGMGLLRFRASLQEWLAECTEPCEDTHLAPSLLVGEYLLWPKALAGLSEWRVASELTTLPGLQRVYVDQRWVYAGRRLRRSAAASAVTPGAAAPSEPEEI